jgi:penicillin amidase
MRLLRPLLPDTPAGRILGEWDLSYGPESRGAFLFERVYQSLLLGVFGEGGLGPAVGEYLWKESGTFADFHHNFDRVLLSERSAWFRGEERDTLYRRAAEKALAVDPVLEWGDVQRVTLSHLLFGGRLPRFLGFDRGPIVIRGGRATVHQGQVYRSAGRATSFAPSFRFVTDFARDEVRSALCGGPSDRRFSKWYASGVSDWLEGRYKTLRPAIPDPAAT